MSADSYRREIQRHQTDVANLQRRKADAARSMAASSKRAHEAAQSANRSSSVTTMQSRLRDAQRHESEAVRIQSDIANLERQLGQVQQRLHDAQKHLANEERREAERRDRAEQTERRRGQSVIAGLSQRVGEHDRLHESAQSAIERLSRLPQRVNVLFLAANPIDQTALRLDEEARAIEEMIRKSKHRDSIHFHSRWAVRSGDILQALNEVSPHIVHFSGHGSASEELVLQTAEGTTKLVTKEAIVQAMATGSDTIRLVFFNACFSQGQAEAVVHHVDAAIGMSVAIGDEAARVFAAQFYSTIGFGKSVQNAFAQAKAALLLEGIPEDQTPQLFGRAGVDLAGLVIVRPTDHELGALAKADELGGHVGRP